MVEIELDPIRVFEQDYVDIKDEQVPTAIFYFANPNLETGETDNVGQRLIDLIFLYKSQVRNIDEEIGIFGVIRVSHERPIGNVSVTNHKHTNQLMLLHHTFESQVVSFKHGIQAGEFQIKKPILPRGEQEVICRLTIDREDEDGASIIDMFYLQNFPKLHNGHQLTIESEKGSDSVTFSFVKPIIESD